MQDNIKDLHTALISDGHYSVDDLGDEKEFREYISKPENARAFHKAVLSDGHYKEADLGNEGEFMKYVGAVEAPQQTQAAPAQATTQAPAAQQQPAAVQSGATRRTEEKPGFFAGMFGAVKDAVASANNGFVSGLQQGGNPTQSIRGRYEQGRAQENAVRNENILSVEEEVQMRANKAGSGSYWQQPSPMMPEEKSELDKTWGERMGENPMERWGKEKILEMRDKQKEAEDYERAMDRVAVPASAYNDTARKAALDAWKKPMREQGATEEDINSWMAKNGLDTPEKVNELADELIRDQWQQAGVYKTYRQLNDDVLSEFRAALGRVNAEGAKAQQEYYGKQTDIKSGFATTPGADMTALIMGEKVKNVAADPSKAISAAVQKAQQVAQEYGLGADYAKGVMNQAYNELIQARVPQSKAENIIINGLGQSIVGQAVSYATKTDFERMLDQTAQAAYDENVGIPESVLKGIATFVGDSWMYILSGGTAGAVLQGGAKKAMGAYIARGLVKRGLSKEMAAAAAERIIATSGSFGIQAANTAAHGAGTFAAAGAIGGGARAAMNPGQMKQDGALQPFDEINPTDYRLRYEAGAVEGMTPEEQEAAYNRKHGEAVGKESRKGAMFGALGGALFMGGPMSSLVTKTGVVGGLARSGVHLATNTAAMTAQQAMEVAAEGQEAWQQWDPVRAAAENLGTNIGLGAMDIYRNVRNYKKMDAYRERMQNLNEELKNSEYKSLRDAIAKMGTNTSGAYDVEGKGMKTVGGKHNGFTAEQIEGIRKNAHDAVASGVLSQESASTLVELLTGQGMKVNPAAQVDWDVTTNGYVVNEYDAAGNTVRTKTFDTHAQAMVHMMKVQHAADMEAAGQLESAVNQAHALENARAFVEQAYSNGVAEKVAQYEEVRKKFNQWMSVKEKQERGEQLTEDEEMLLRNKPALTPEEQAVMNNAPTDLERNIVAAHSLSESTGNAGRAVEAYKAIIGQMSDSSNFAAEFAGRFEQENGLDENAVVRAYQPMTAEERDAWVEEHPNREAPHKYGNGFSTPEMDAIRRRYQEAMTEYVKNARSAYETPEGAAAEGQRSERTLIEDQSGATRRTVEGGAGEAPAGSAAVETAANGGGETAGNAAGTVAVGTGGAAEAALANGGAADANLSPAERLAKGIGERVTQQQERGKKVVQDGGVGAAELQTEYDTAVARVARAFAEGSQNAAVAADVKSMADSGRAKAAYQYLSDKKGELTDYQYKALEQYIDAQTAVMSMEIGIGDAVESAVRVRDTMMSVLTNEDGRIQQVEVLPMGDGSGGGMAFIKSGSLTNQYGKIVQVRYVTIDGNGTLWPGETVQIAKSRIKQGSVTEAVPYDMYMEDYRKQVSAQMAAEWQQKRAGLGYNVGDVVQVRTGNTDATAVIKGTDGGGKIVIADANEPDNQMLWTAIPKAQLDQMIQTARQNKVAATLTAEASQQIAEQKRQKIQAQEQKRTADIVGYSTGGLLTTQGGRIDIAHKDTKAQTAAAYLVENQGSNAKAVSWVEGEKMQLVQRQEQLIEQQRELDQWMGMNSGRGDADEPKVAGQLESIKAQLQEISQRYDKLNEIRYHAMTPEMRQKFMAERNKFILDAKKAAAAKAAGRAPKKVVKDRFGRELDEEGEVKISTLEKDDAAQFLLDNYETEMDAHSHLQYLFDGLQRQLRQVDDNLARQNSSYQAFREGRTDLEAEDLRITAESEQRLQQQRDELVKEITAINKLDKQLEKIYKERNEALDAADPTKGRVDRIMRKSTPEGRLRQAEKEYEQYPEALAALESGTEPQTIEEYVSQIGPGSLNFEDIYVGESKVIGLQSAIGKNMTRTRGVGKNRVTGDTVAFDYVLAQKPEQGKGFQEVVHKLWEGRPVEAWSDQDIANALIDVLMRVSKPEELRFMVVNNRIAEAEAAASHQDQEEERQRDEAEYRRQQEMLYGGSESAAVETAANGGSAAETPLTTGGNAGSGSQSTEPLGTDVDPFTSGDYDPFDFALGDNEEATKKHNEAVAKRGGLIQNEGTRALDFGTARLLDSVGRQTGKCITIKTAQEIWDELSEEHRKFFRVKENLARAGKAYYRNGTNEIIFNGAWMSTQENLVEAARFVLGHEVTHVIKSMGSPETWAAYVEAVKAAMGSDFDKALNSIRRRYGNMPGYTGADKEQKFVEEVCADFAGSLKFRTDADVEKFIDSIDAAGVDMSAYMDTIRRMLDMLKDLEDMAAEMKAAGMLDDYEAEDVKDYVEEALGEWDKLYDEATKKVEAQKAAEAVDGGADWALVTDAKEVEAFDKAPKKVQYRTMQVVDGLLYPPMAMVTGKGKEKKRQDGLRLGDLFKADENPDLAKPVMDKKTGEQKINEKTGKPQYTFKLDKGGKDDFGEKLTDVNAAYNPYVHTSNSPINDQLSTSYKRSNMVVVKGEISLDDIGSGYWADKAHDSVGEKDWKLGSVSTALEKAGRIARKVTLSQYFRPTEIVPVEEVAEFYAKQLEGTGIEVPFNTVTPELREALVERGVAIGEPENSNAGETARPYYEEWKASAAVETAANGGADSAGEPLNTNGGAAETPLANKKGENGLFGYFTGTLHELYELSKEQGNKLVKKILAPIKDRLINELKAKGLELSPSYKHTIDNYAINHIIKSHSDKKEKERGQIPVTEEDIAKINDIVENFNEVAYFDGRQPTRIIYRKSMPDGTTLFVEEVRKGRKELAAVSMRKYKNSNLTIEDLKIPTSNTPEATMDLDAVSKATESGSGLALTHEGNVDLGRISDAKLANYFEAAKKIAGNIENDAQNGENVQGNQQKNKWKKEEEIIGELSEPAPSESASNPSKPQTPNNSGKEPLNAKGQLSGGKGTENSGNNQINREENTENQPKTADNVQGAAEAPLANKWRVDNELAGKEVKIAKGDRNHGFATNKDASDWAKTNIAKTYNNEETGGKGTIRVSNASIQKFLSGKAFAQSSDRDSHLAALKAMPELLKTSIDVEQHPDRRKNEKGERDEAAGINPNIVIHRLYGALDLDGQLYRVKITLKENTQTREATKAYSYETTKIELLDGQSEDVTKTPSRNSNNSISAAKLLKNIKSSYNKGKYLLDESEKLTESRLNGAQNGENVQGNQQKTADGDVQWALSIEKAKGKEDLVAIIDKKLDGGKNSLLTQWKKELSGENRAPFGRQPEEVIEQLVFNKLGMKNPLVMNGRMFGYDPQGMLVDILKKATEAAGLDAKYRDRVWDDPDARYNSDSADTWGHWEQVNDTWKKALRDGEPIFTEKELSEIREALPYEQDKKLFDTALQGIEMTHKVNIAVDKIKKLDGGKAVTRLLFNVADIEEQERKRPKGERMKIRDIVDMAAQPIGKYLTDGIAKAMGNDDVQWALNEQLLDQQINWALGGEIGAKNLDEAAKRKMMEEDEEKTEDNLLNLRIAKELEERGGAAEDIKYSTGWERGVDGLWRLELPDLELRVEPEDDKYNVFDIDGLWELKLSDIVKNDNGLFEAYPELADLDVMGVAEGSTLGSYNPETNTLKLNVQGLDNAGKSLYQAKMFAEGNERFPIEDLAELEGMTVEEYKTVAAKKLEAAQKRYDNELNELKDTLAHEVQHYIQHVEGFAQGGNQYMDAPESVKAERRAERKGQLQKLNEQLDEASDKTDEAELAYRDAHKKYNRYVYVEDKENGGWAYSAEKSKSEEGKRLEAEAKRLNSIYEKAYDEEKAISDKIRKIEEEINAPLGRDGYWRLAGEVEARAVGERVGLTDEERRESLAREQIRIRPERQIVVREMKPNAAESARYKETAEAQPLTAVNGGAGGDMQWMLGEITQHADVTTEANKEAFEKVKYEHPEKTVAMKDGAGYVSFGSDARRIAEAIGRSVEDGMLRLNQGEYMAAKEKLGDELDEAHWSGFEEWRGVDDSTWADGKVRGKDAKAFVRDYPELRRLREAIVSAAVETAANGGAEAQPLTAANGGTVAGREAFEAACEDYRRAIEEMLDGDREDFKVLSGARKVLVEQLSELNDIQEGKKVAFDIDAPADKAAKGSRGTRGSRSSRETRETRGARSSRETRETRGASGSSGSRAGKTAEVKGKTQKEWQVTSPTEYELWENTGMGQEDALGEYYDGDWQALCHAVKRGESGAIREAARRMAVMFNALPDKSNGSTTANEAREQMQGSLVFVPVPSHSGKATYMLKVAKELSKLTGIPYADILEAEPHDSHYQAKAEGREVDIVVRTKEGARVPEGADGKKRMPILLDNVEVSGKTLKACKDALQDQGMREASGLVKTGTYKMVLAKDNSGEYELGQQKLKLTGKEAAVVKMQRGSLPMMYTANHGKVWEQWYKIGQDDADTIDGVDELKKWLAYYPTEGRVELEDQVWDGKLSSEEVQEAVEAWIQAFRDKAGVKTTTEPWAHVKKVSVHTSNMRRRYPQLWEAAKHGDVKAAYELVKSVVKPSVVMKLAVEHPDAIVAYPHYEDRTRKGEDGEIMGTNAIPQAYAETFERFGMIVDSDIMQVNRVSRTDATRYDRLMNRARFKGDVVPGQEYILVDDHITSGATLRDMKDYIESRGGTVVAISALEGSAGSTNIEITDDIINELDKLGVTDEHLQNLGISRSRNSLTAAEAREIIVLAKRGRDFRSKAQKEEHNRATQGDEKARRRARADERAAAAESRRLRERAEAEERFNELRRERERFVELFGEMPESAAVETAANEGAAEAPLATGGRYADVGGVKPAEDGFYDSAGEPLNTNAESWKSQIEAARAAVNANPTDGQKEAGNYRKGHLRLDGFNISIENAKGSTRSGRDADGKEWSVTMHYDYGDIRGRVGVDGDNIDVYLSDKPYEGNVYVVDQVDPKTGKFDEHKVMYGFGSVEEAKEAYLSNYEDGWQGLGDITEVSKELFKEWLESSKRKQKPFAEYVMVKRAKHPDTGLTEKGRAEIERIQREMAAEIEAEAQRYIEDERKKDIEEVYGRYPGDPVSLRDRGITLTDAQRWVFRNQIKRAFEVMGRQADLDRYYEAANNAFRGKKKVVTDPSTGKEHKTSVLIQAPNAVDFYPGQEIWFPERAPEVDEEFEKLMRPEWISPNAAGNRNSAGNKSDAVETATNKEAEAQPLTAVNGGTETAGNAAGTAANGEGAGSGSQRTEPQTIEPEEEPFELTPEETEAERARRLRREGARRRFWNRLDGKELDAERDDIKDKPAAKKSAAVETATNKTAGNAAGTVAGAAAGNAAGTGAGAAVRVEKDGQLAFMESGPDTGVSMTGDDVMELQWALGVNANRPRKKRGESDFAYLARVAAWEAQQERLANLPPAPDQEEIDGRWMSQFESDHAAWLERHGLDGRPLGAQPEREDFESVDDYAEALRQWEQRRDAMADADDPEPIQLDYMVKAQDEYRDAYLQWKRDNDVNDDEDMALGFSSLFTGEVPQPRTVVGTNVETGETVELPADEELAAEVAQSEQVLSEIGAHTGFANTPAGARKAVKIAIIERRKTLESSGAEDAIFLHELKKDMEAVGKELGKKGEELDKMMPFIVEAPTRLAEVIGELYYAARQRPLKHYLIKGALPEIMSGEATDEALINGIRSVVDSALEGGVKQLEDAVRDYNYYRDPRVKPIVDKVMDWYQEFYTLIESKGLRRGAGYVSNYVNHVWSKELSDPKAYETYVRTTSPNMRQRQLSTYAKGVEIGLAPKYEKLTEMMAHYSRQNNEAIANRELLDYLTGLTVDLLNSDGEVVNVLSVLSSEEPNGFVKDRYVRYEVPGVGGVWVLRDVQKRFATIFGQEWNRDANEGENKFWRLYDRTGDLMKSIQLSLSGFHALALTEVALVQKNPLKALGDVMKFTFWDSLRAGTTPPMAHPEEFKDAAAHLVKLGASDDYAAAEVHTMTGKLRKMAQEVYDKQKVLGAVPLLTTSLLDWMNKGMDKLLWEYIHDGLKVAAFRGYANSLRAKAKKEGWSERQLDKMLDEAGQYVNDAFGGQYWEVIGMTPSTLRTLRRVLLSPDWFVSTSRHAMSMTGFGSLYAPEGFMDYVTMRNKWGKSGATRRTEEATASDFGQEADEEIGNEGRKFRSKGAWLCYAFLVPVFYGGIMNVLNAAFRKLDEEREKEKAEEMRKTNPEYRSPYELVYPDGMKWYDYTMYGNSEGNNTQLFVGRYEDGTERYIRWGKQFREIPEFFMGRYGVEVPGPLMERMMGKSNPVAGTMLDMLRYYGAGLLNKTPEQKDLEEKYGKHIGALAMVARKFLPFSVPTQEDKEFYWSDLVMPSKKGFSNWRALDAYEHFILAGDMDGIAAVTNACIMNGINAEEKLEAAIKRVEAMQKKERGTGVEDMQSAMAAFEASESVKDRKALKKKIAVFMLKEQYRTFTAQDARERVEERLNGTDEVSEGITRDQSDKYLLLLSADDVRDDIRLSKAKKAADAVVKEGKSEAANGDGGAYLRAHGREVRVKTVIGKYNAAINKLKKTLGKGDDEAVMQKIAELRKKALAEVER